jgi:hypothetical protein
MNRRKFLQFAGFSVIAALGSQILAACGGGGASSGSGSGSSGAGSGCTSDPNTAWETCTVSGSSGGVTKSYTVEIEDNHSHNATAFTVATFETAGTNLTIKGNSEHPHYIDISSANVATLGTVGGVVTLVSTVQSGHPHNVRVTRTA